MNTIRLTTDNVFQYIGREIIFKTRDNNHLVKRIMRVSPTGKTVYIDHPDLNNNLVISREIYVIC
jgi:hypothetical protein